ncbi:DUF4189 domain-containing protein [Nocardia jiangxiensis]|uniref:DUF4189 domain-containing protein n=1 Tax=Nocardia jiangxiensis TaxID=282685 RepID=A0ABW6S8L0_9NOCA|nr:DUF4189 domain-containing protein [Nocardia jiangxiensis]
MSLLGKSLAAMVIATSGAIVVVGAGTANAAGDLYGAIASGMGHAGSAVDYPNQAAAEKAALAACSRTGGRACVVMTRMHNECGSLVEKDVQNAVGPFVVSSTQRSFYTGTGPTRAAAEQKAKFAPDHQLDEPWVLRVVRPAFVVDTVCTANAG